MSILYSFLFAIIILILTYPYLKNYQLEGYNLQVFFNKIFTYKYTFKGKNLLKFTKRMIRFLILFGLLLFCLSILIFLFINNVWLVILNLLILVIFTPVIFSVAHIILIPIERFIKRNYISKTKQRLKKFKGIKIAITGSFGKTSVKNILYHLLSEKFNVICSPKNYNTPMGVCKTVKEVLKEDTQIAIFEMGARQEGDIRELMEIIDPDIGILTAIGEQHIETFGDLKGILRTKNEIVKYIKKSGKIFFNGKNENTLSLFKSCDKTKILSCNENGVSDFSNIKYSSQGMSFELKIGSHYSSVNTKLLGRINCENIVLASTVAEYLGINFEEIVNRIKSLSPVKNRLELIDMNDFIIIDDSYNANEIGAIESLNVLREFSGKKIVITSGLVEMGRLQFEKNFKLGKEIAKSANIVVIMNETNKKAIYLGLKKEGFNDENIFFASNREEQIDIIKRITQRGCVFLFQNDLPDNYR